NTTNNQNIVTGSGKVGLGTTSPYSLLSISNSASTAANTPLFTIASTTAGTATSTLLTVLASGKVGIGTEGPDDILHVQKNDAAGSFIKLGNTLGRAKMITAAPSGSDSFFQANYSVGNWAFGSHGADENKFKIANAADFDSAVRLTVDGSGNVGIGTTTPNWLLQTAGTRPFFALSDTGASANLKHWTMSSQSGNFYIATSSDALATSTIPALMIDSNGNLGISTTSPYAKLSVNGLLAAANFNADNASATSTLAGGLTVGGTSLVVDYSSGNVGIGTTGPGVKLEVYGSYGTPLINLNAAGANQAPFSLGIDTTASNFGLGIWYNSLQQATFENGGLALGSYFSSNVPSNSLIVSGNVGIGTTSPMSVLSVVGNIAVSGCVQAATSSYNITPENNCADIAEYYPNSEAVEPGDIVALDPVSSLNIRKATSSNLVIGIVSTNPAVLFEGSMSFFGGAPPPAGGAYPVNSKAPLALAGRVPVKVNLEGGEIQVGDRIAVSSAPGIGKKATSSGMTVGIALESFDGTTSLVTPGVDKILVFVNLGYSKLDSAIANGGVMLDGESESAFWGIDESSGQIKFINGLDLNDFGMINVKAIRGSVNPATGGASWSIDSQGKLLVQEVETEKLKVSSEATFGSQEKRIGITIYDEDTGQPYCIKVKNGAMVSAAGACGAETNASEITNNNPPPPNADGGQITNNDQITNDQNTEPGGETSNVEEPVVEPAASDGEPEVSLVPEEPTASTTPGA
ncbi:MAG: FG-GAP repeat protein, partial [Parcubacteria group bacterium GW2011_GWB1_41_6]